MKSIDIVQYHTVPEKEISFPNSSEVLLISNFFIFITVPRNGIEPLIKSTTKFVNIINAENTMKIVQIVDYGTVEIISTSLGK